MYKTVNGKWGEVTFFAKDEYVGRSLYNYGEYGPDETDMILSLASGTCLDIGANIGCISQALLYNGFVVHAFEPQPEVFRLLNLNLCSPYAWAPIDAQAGTVVSQTYKVALGSESGVAKMPKVQYSIKGNFGGLGIGTSSYLGSYDVPVRTLDSYNFEDVGFIKIDVEGFEEKVLVGGRETIKRCRPIMYIEDDRTEKSASLRKYIQELGYSIQEHKPTLYRENNFFGLKNNIWDRNYASHNLICRPC